jgi:hypothetical protein
MLGTLRFAQPTKPSLPPPYSRFGKTPLQILNRVLSKNQARKKISQLKINAITVPSEKSRLSAI